MFILSKVEQYRENNRLEAKKALGGLPKSIWETYSAFANAQGGIILLGVEEYKDHSLHTIDLPEPERLVSEFLELLNDPEKVSTNILDENDVRIETVNGDRIIVIKVPPAHKYSRPIYIDGDPYTGSYRRSGEGDFKLSRREVDRMLRDAGSPPDNLSIM